MASDRPSAAAEFDRTSPTIWVETSNGNSNPKAAKTRIDQSIRIISLTFNDGPVGILSAKGKGGAGSANAKSINKLTLEVENFDLKNHEDFTFAVGGSLSVQWGYPGRMGPKRHACITKVTGDHKLKVECRARSILMHRQTKVRNFVNMSHAEIATQILRENGYAPQDMDVEATDVRYGVVNQAGLTDHQMLAQIAEEEGFEYFDDTGATGVHFRRPTYGAPPVRELRYFTPPAVGEIEKFSTDGSLTARPTSVTTKGIDPRTKAPVQAAGGDAETKRGGQARRVDAETQEIGNKYQKPVQNPAAAKRVADRTFLGATQGTFKLKLDVIGDAQLLSKSVVKVTGITKRVDGLFYVAAIKHTIKAGHFKMQLECKSDSGVSASTAASKAKQAQGAQDPGRLAAVNREDQSVSFRDPMGRTTAAQAIGQRPDGSLIF